jgi:hypothetical protein
MRNIYESRGQEGVGPVKSGARTTAIDQNHLDNNRTIWMDGLNQ